LPPALVLHGGPGGNHHNLVSFQALADTRPVIFYDQIGCGKSDRPEDPSLWVAERYFDEVKTIHDGLGLKKYHLIGHSWGTALAVGFAAKHHEGILSISLHSPILSFRYYIHYVALRLLPNGNLDLQKTLRSGLYRGSAHMTPVDKPGELVRLQREFLTEVEN
jgi:proline-specific peptidase